MKAIVIILVMMRVIPVVLEVVEQNLVKILVKIHVYIPRVMDLVKMGARIIVLLTV